MSKNKKLILAALPILALFLFGGFIYYQYISEVKKYDFALQGATKEIKLSDFRGKKVLVYFGYGLCPDICPTTLTATAQALQKLTKEELDGVEAVFVSLDPARDKPKDLDTFAKYFHPKIIGVTSNDELYLKKVSSNYGANYQKVSLPNSSIEYSLAHTADLYLIGKNGKLEAVLQFGVEPDEIVKAIKK